MRKYRKKVKRKSLQEKEIYSQLKNIGHSVLALLLFSRRHYFTAKNCILISYRLFLMSCSGSFSAGSGLVHRKDDTRYDWRSGWRSSTCGGHYIRTLDICFVFQSYRQHPLYNSHGEYALKLTNHGKFWIFSEIGPEYPWCFQYSAQNT